VARHLHRLQIPHPVLHDLQAFRGQPGRRLRRVHSPAEVHRIQTSLRDQQVKHRLGAHHRSLHVRGRRQARTVGQDELTRGPDHGLVHLVEEGPVARNLVPLQLGEGQVGHRPDVDRRLALPVHHPLRVGHVLLDHADVDPVRLQQLHVLREFAPGQRVPGRDHLDRLLR